MRAGGRREGLATPWTEIRPASDRIGCEFG